MNFHNKKTQKLIAMIIVGILIISLLAPVLISAFR